jgi:hypothetical protein
MCASVHWRPTILRAKDEALGTILKREQRRIGVWCRVASVVALLSFARGASADTFARVYYDRATDELVVTMHYRGTNPNHRFSLQLGDCKPAGSGGDPSGAEVSGEVLDSQASDAARAPFTQTTRFDLSGIPCRPAKLTLRTAPRFLYVVQIPAAP